MTEVAAEISANLLFKPSSFFDRDGLCVCHFNHLAAEFMKGKPLPCIAITAPIPEDKEKNDNCI